MPVRHGHQASAWVIRMNKCLTFGPPDVIAVLMDPLSPVYSRVLPGNHSLGPPCGSQALGRQSQN